MTKDYIETILKRFVFINKAIDKDLKQAVFYIGNRKQVIEITDTVISVCQLVNIIYKSENNEWVKLMIKLITTGERDKYIINKTHNSKNAYYNRKLQFINKIYCCCISWGLISFEEILMEQIG